MKISSCSLHRNSDQQVFRSICAWYAIWTNSDQSFQPRILYIRTSFCLPFQSHPTHWWLFAFHIASSISPSLVYHNPPSHISQDDFWSLLSRFNWLYQVPQLAFRFSQLSTWSQRHLCRKAWLALIEGKKPRPAAIKDATRLPPTSSTPSDSTSTSSGASIDTKLHESLQAWDTKACMVRESLGRLPDATHREMYFTECDPATVWKMLKELYLGKDKQ